RAALDQRRADQLEIRGDPVLPSELQFDEVQRRDRAPRNPHHQGVRNGAVIDLVVLDVGNTALKVGLFAGDRLVDRAAFSHDDADSLSNARSFVHRAGATARLAVCSVDPDRAAKIVTALRPAASEETSGRPALVAPRDFTAPVRNDCDPPDSVGLDRLFNAAAVAGAPRPVVVVDAGTAVTVDRVEPPGV